MEAVIGLALMSFCGASCCVYRCCLRRYDPVPDGVVVTNALRIEWGLPPEEVRREPTVAMKD